MNMVLRGRSSCMKRLWGESERSSWWKCPSCLHDWRWFISWSFLVSCVLASGWGIMQKMEDFLVWREVWCAQRVSLTSCTKKEGGLAASRSFHLGHTVPSLSRIRIKAAHRKRSLVQEKEEGYKLAISGNKSAVAWEKKKKNAATIEPPFLLCCVLLSFQGLVQRTQWVIGRARERWERGSLFLQTHFLYCYILHRERSELIYTGELFDSRKRWNSSWG